jgi:beta-fructofuranosidase
VRSELFCHLPSFFRAGEDMLTDRRDFLTMLVAAGALPAFTLRTRAARLSDSGLAAQLAADPLRPQYHLLPAANWMNDPNGPIYWNGSYHMFYQYNPEGAYWGDMHWGHAVSPDMVHWRHLPIALSPTPGGPDSAGCFTGTAAVDDGRVMMMYTGVRAVPRDQATVKDGNPPLRESQCLAIANDPDLKTWTKIPTPVIADPPRSLEVNGFRDPSPWREGDWWYTVLASGVADEGGAVLLYRSRDLRTWEYVHILARRDRSGSAAFDSFDPWEVWECPDFFPLGDRHVLIFSTAGKTYWQTGKLDEQTMKFQPERAGIVDYGSYYAAKTQLDKGGNRILWGWITESRSLAEYKAAGWAGMMSLPRVLSIAADGGLRFTVAPEVNQLRGREESIAITPDQQRNQHQLDSLRIEACCGEILCVVNRTAEPFELVLSGSGDDAAPWLTLGYDPHHPEQVFIDSRPIPMALDEKENLEFHLYVDGSVIEVLVNRQTACTRRFYYSGNTPQDLRLRWTGSISNIVRMSVWRLSPISSDRLTA